MEGGEVVILPILGIVALAGALTGKKKAVAAVATKFVSSQQRRLGYRYDEGICSPQEVMWVGGDDPLGLGLKIEALLEFGELVKFRGAGFVMTRSEAELLGAMMDPAIETMRSLLQLQSSISEHPELEPAMVSLEGSLSLQVKPIENFLNGFPPSRRLKR